MADVHPVTHVIFDLDGLLLDTERMYFEVREKLCKKYKKEYTLEFHADTSGVRGLEACELIVSKLQLPLTAEEFYNQSKELYQKEFPSAILKPGAERLIRHLHSHKIPMAVATSSSRGHIELKFTNHQDLFSLMDHVVSGTSDEEVKNGKPAPDIFLVCASKFQDSPLPEKVLVFEDAPNGVLAARAAGMQVVMVPEDHIPEEKRSQATLVLPSLEVFQPELFGLPPF
ncbi:hypothetical protein R5R35_009183 [Gryllus longicercus]